MKQIFIYASYLSPLVLSIGIIAGIVLRNNLDYKYRVLTGYIFFLLLIDSIHRYWGLLTVSRNNLFVNSIYGLGELTILAMVYFKGKLIPKGKPVIIFLIVSSALIIIDIFYSFNLSAQEYQTYGKTISNFTLVVFSLVCLFRIIKGESEIEREIVLFNFCVLIFFAMDLIILLSINFLINAELKVSISFWYIRLISTILFHSFLIYLIWRNGRTRKYLRSG